jgi:hypothetical protein
VSKREREIAREMRKKNPPTVKTTVTSVKTSMDRPIPVEHHYKMEATLKRLIPVVDAEQQVRDQNVMQR